MQICSFNGDNIKVLYYRHKAQKQLIVAYLN